MVYTALLAPYVYVTRNATYYQSHPLFQIKTSNDIDKRLCETFMEIQLFSQKVYFGKFTNDYFAHRDEQVAENAVDSTVQKSQDLLEKVNKEFSCDDFATANHYSMSNTYVLLKYFVQNKMLEKVRKGKRTVYIKK